MACACKKSNSTTQPKKQISKQINRGNAPITKQSAKTNKRIIIRRHL